VLVAEELVESAGRLLVAAAVILGGLVEVRVEVAAAPYELLDTATDEVDGLLEVTTEVELEAAA
jgi:hypothetical protein